MLYVRETWRSCAPSLKWKFCASLAALVLGLICIAIGVSMNIYLLHRLGAEVEKFLVVDSEQDDGFDEWEHNDYPDAVPHYMKVYMWNLTNADALLQSNASSPVVPEYQQVGPFIYQKFIKKINITFLDGGEKVSYANWIYYVFQEDMSVGDPNVTYITNLNQAYLGILAQTKSESGLVLALEGPALLRVMDQLEDLFVPAVVQQAVASIAPIVEGQVIAAIAAEQNISESEATDVFLSVWANATSAPNPTQIWQSIGLVSENSSSPSEISYNSASNLWLQGSSLPNLVNSSFSSTLLWYSALAMGDSTTGQAARQMLQALFGLSPSQLQLVLNWRLRFTQVNGNLIDGALFAKFNVTSRPQIAYLQWGTGSVTNYTSVKDLDPSNPFNIPAIPEFGIWSRNNYPGASLSFNATFSERLLNDTSLGLFQTHNLISFVTLVAQGDDAQLREMWGLGLTEAMQVAAYFSYVGTTFVTEATLDPIFAQGGGLITTRSVSGWLWGTEDALLVLLGQNGWVALVANYSDEEEALAHTVNSLLYTGKHDLDLIAQYIDYEGHRVYPAGTLWAEDLEVSGTDGTQFKPFLDEGDRISAWIAETMRPMQLQSDQNVDIKGIRLYRYRLSQEDFAVQPKFYQTIEGFANMTSLYAGTPIFVSKPNMYDCPAEWRDKVGGLNATDADDTFIDVEPITGLVMDVEKKLQINLYLYEEGSPLNLFNKNFPKGIIYPLFWANEAAEITDHLADDFKNNVYFVVTLRIVIFWVGVAGGGVLVAIGLVVLIYVLLKNRSYWRGYQTIGESSDEEYHRG